MKKVLLTFFMALLVAGLHAQVGINTDTPDATGNASWVSPDEVDSLRLIENTIFIFAEANTLNFSGMVYISDDKGKQATIEILGDRSGSTGTANTILLESYVNMKPVRKL